MQFTSLNTENIRKTLATFIAALVMIFTSNFTAADIFNDIVNIQVDDLTAGIEAVASATDVIPLEFDLELEHTELTGFDLDITPAGGCDFMINITHFAPTDSVIGEHEWIISDIHMRTPNGDELFAKITDVELLFPTSHDMPTTDIAFTDWVVALSTGPFFSLSTGASNDYIVRVAVIGDVNKDCNINLLDIDPFVELLADNGYSTEADINQDGILNLLDVSEFIGLLSE